MKRGLGFAGAVPSPELNPLIVQGSTMAKPDREASKIPGNYAIVPYLTLISDCNRTSQEISGVNKHEGPEA
jgi:hypothetical protein